MNNQPTVPVAPRQYVGLLLSVHEFVNALQMRLAGYEQIVDFAATVRQNVHSYFYNELLALPSPTDVYLGAVVAYKVNQNTIDQTARHSILSLMADMQWLVHDYISTSVQRHFGLDVVRETEYYYNLDTKGRLMVYVPLLATQSPIGVASFPEAAIVYSCYNFLPMEKKLAYAKAMALVTPKQPAF